jgi:hypothetical protein
MINISFSSINTFLRCPRAFKLCYVDKKKIQVQSDAMVLGCAIDDHLGGKKVTMNGCSDQTKGIARAIMKAIKDLKIGFSKGKGFESQVMFKNKIKSDTSEIQLIGFADFFNKQTGELIELKTTSKPEYYQSLNNISPQLSMYLMAIKGVKKVRVATITTPKINKTKKFITDTQYINHVYNDIIDRPKFYFNDLLEDGTFGKPFSIGTLQSDVARKNVFYVRDAIDACTKKDYWPKNLQACSNQGYSAFKCDYCEYCEGTP